MAARKAYYQNLWFKIIESLNKQVHYTEQQECESQTSTTNFMTNSWTKAHFNLIVRLKCLYFIIEYLVIEKKVSKSQKFLFFEMFQNFYKLFINKKKLFFSKTYIQDE